MPEDSTDLPPTEPSAHVITSETRLDSVEQKTEQPNRTSRPRVVRESIKERIRELIFAEVPPTAIAKQLQIPRSTYYHYMDKISKEGVEESLEKLNVLLYKYMIRTERLIQRLERKYEETGDYRVLLAINAVVQQTMERYESIGLFDKKADAAEKVIAFLRKCRINKPGSS